MLRPFLCSAAFFIACQSSVAKTVEIDAPLFNPLTVTGKVSTFGATKSDVPIVETARSVSVITSEQFTERGALTLDDTLGYTAGAVSDTFGFSTRGDFPRIRGLSVPEYLDNIQVLFGFYNTTRSEVYMLDQVEVLKGPASVLYGAGSPGGIVNAISKQAGRNHLGKELLISGGNNSRREIATDLGFDLSGNGNLTARLVALIRKSDTQVDFVEDDSMSLAPSITFENDTTRLTALFNYSKRDSDTAQQFVPLTVSGCASSQVSVSNPALCAGATGEEVDSSFYAGDPNFNRYQAESTSLTLFAEHSLNDIFSLEGTVRYRDSDVDYRQALIAPQVGNPGTFPGLFAPSPFLPPDGTALGRVWYDLPAQSDQIAVDARLRANFDTGRVSHDILVGLNYQNIDTQINGASLLYPSPAAAAALFPVGFPTTFNAFSPNYDGSEIPADAVFDAARVLTRDDIDTRAFHISDQIEFGRLIVNAGIRYDDIESSDGVATQRDYATTYSAGALYKTAMGIYPYISYAESFTPVFGSSAFIPPGSSTGAALKPEEGEQTEVGVKYQPPGSQAFVTFSYFDLEQINLEDPLAFPGTPRTQNGEVKIKGIEVEGAAVIGDFHLHANFSLLDTENQFGEVVDYIPEKQASAWVTWAPSRGQLAGLRIGTGIRYAGENESNATVYLLPTPLPGSLENATVDGYTVADALVSYDFDQFTLAMNVRNLFDREYYAACAVAGGCFAGERRSAVATLKFKF